MNGICGCSYCDRSAGDDQVIVGGYPMSIFCVYSKASAAVDRQIVMCENSSVRPVFQCLLRVSRTTGESVLAAFSERQEDFVRLFHPDTCIVAAVDLYSVKKDEYFGGIIGVHRQITVSE